jgi:hypothetical protein
LSSKIQPERLNGTVADVSSASSRYVITNGSAYAHGPPDLKFDLFLIIATLMLHAECGACRDVNALAGDLDLKLGVRLERIGQPPERWPRFSRQFSRSR